jgi:hypothetical protein
VIDIFSKFLWSFPLKNKSSSIVAFTLQNLFLSEGHPQILGSDNGTEFKSEVNELTEGVKLEEDIDEMRGFMGGNEMKVLGTRFSIDFRHGQPISPKRWVELNGSIGTLEIPFSYFSRTQRVRGGLISFRSLPTFTIPAFILPLR